MYMCVYDTVTPLNMSQFVLCNVNPINQLLGKSNAHFMSFRKKSNHRYLRDLHTKWQINSYVTLSDYCWLREEYFSDVHLFLKIFIKNSGMRLQK